MEKIRKRATRRRMSPAEFAAVRQLLNISDKRIESAYCALVEGRTMKAIADEYGCTPQAVKDNVDRACECLDKYRKAQAAEREALDSQTQ